MLRPKLACPQKSPLREALNPYDSRNESGVHHAIDGRRTGELLGEGSLQLAQLGLQGSDAPIELALGAQQHREVGAQVCPREAPEVPLAAEAVPLGEDGQGKDLALGKEDGTAGLAKRTRGMVGFPPIVHEDVQ
jgi:hypothetical protein